MTGSAARRSLAARWLAGVLVVALCAFLIWAPLAAAAPPLLIVPGQTVGPVQLGMHVDDVRAALGRPTIGRRGELVFPGWGIVVIAQEGAAVRIITTNPAFRTATGAGVKTALNEAEALIGDRNEVISHSGPDTTVLFPFQGIGFVFRASRATETFVVARIPLGPVMLPPPPPPPNPAGAGGVTAPGPAAPVAAAPPSTAAAGTVAASNGLEIRNLAEAISATGQFQVTGQVVNLGQAPVGPINVLVTFDRASGDSIQRPTSIQGPVAPGAVVAFTVGTGTGNDLVARYTAQASAEGSAPVQATRSVPVSEYQNLAVQQIKIAIQLGAPANVGNGIQAFVSIVTTGSIPSAWVRDVTVQVPFGNGGGQTVHVAPGQVQMIIVPSVPGPVAPGVTPQLVGVPKVVAVTLAGS